ncbi:MAG TPA: sensor histidine kinase [Actinomycetota bacterium]|nr:sensor histidine kinase [Actinomycetota bacterium]
MPAPRAPAVRVLIAIVLGVSGIAMAAFVAWIHQNAFPNTPVQLALKLIGILTFLGAGLAATARHPESRTGPLMIGSAFAFVAIEIQAHPSPALQYAGNWLGGMPHVLLAHLILTYPTGRFSSRRDKVVVTSAYILVVGLGFLFNHFPYVTWLLSAGVVLTFVVVLLGFERWARAKGALRRALRPLPFASLVFAAAGFRNAVVVFFFVSGNDLVRWIEASSWVLGIATPLVPITFLYGFAQTRRARGALGDLVVQLDSLPETEHLQEALARALRDPSVRLGYWSRETQTYVDAEGHAVQLPHPSDTKRAFTSIEHMEEPLAVVVHDVALIGEHELVEAAVAAARLALVNERLQAEVRAQLEETRASRARIVDATDAERRRLERDLHDGAQQRLVSVSLALRMLQRKAEREGIPLSNELGNAADDLRAAIDELRDLAQGIHPPILTEEGLVPAIDSLVERAPFPVRVEMPDDRLPSSIEATIYFTVAETLTNAAKHSRAKRAEVMMQRTNGWLDLEVWDDGIGGALVEAGSGLGGLADRVAAVSGTMTVDSPPGGGTKVSVRLPCE